jgi:uncharacterized protein (DUF433 family)
MFGGELEFAMPQEWTAAQAAFVLNEPLDAFKKVVERGPVKPRVVRVGGLRVRKFDLGALVFLQAQGELKAELTPKGRAELYAAMTRLPNLDAATEVAFGDLKFAFGRSLQKVESRLKELDKLSGEIDATGGEPMIRGTRVEVFRLAALLDGGMTVEAVLRDYPSLNARQVLAARAYAQINPKIGRPYPAKTAKAAMRERSGRTGFGA